MAEAGRVLTGVLTETLGRGAPVVEEATVSFRVESEESVRRSGDSPTALEQSLQDTARRVHEEARRRLVRELIPGKDLAALPTDFPSRLGPISPLRFTSVDPPLSNARVAAVAAGGALIGVVIAAFPARLANSDLLMGALAALGAGLSVLVATAEISERQRKLLIGAGVLSVAGFIAANLAFRGVMGSVFRFVRGSTPQSGKRWLLAAAGMALMLAARVWVRRSAQGAGRLDQEALAEQLRRGLDGDLRAIAFFLAAGVSPASPTPADNRLARVERALAASAKSIHETSAADLLQLIAQEMDIGVRIPPAPTVPVPPPSELASAPPPVSPGEPGDQSARPLAPLAVAEPAPVPRELLPEASGRGAESLSGESLPPPPRTRKVFTWSEELRGRYRTVGVVRPGDQVLELSEPEEIVESDGAVRVVRPGEVMRHRGE